jgi:quinol monooxygenase YgiN
MDNSIQRIVKMTFKSAYCAAFETYFNEIKDQVGSQPGCKGVKMLKDINNKGVYFTYSFWEDEDSLNAYRHTELFAEVWPKVKAWFDAKPEAWSTLVYCQSKNLQL